MAQWKPVRNIIRGDVLGMGPEGEPIHNSSLYAWFLVERVTPVGHGLVQIDLNEAGWNILRDEEDVNLVADGRDPDILARFAA